VKTKARISEVVYEGSFIKNETRSGLCVSPQLRVLKGEGKTAGKIIKKGNDSIHSSDTSKLNCEEHRQSIVSKQGNISKGEENGQRRKRLGIMKERKLFLTLQLLK